MDWPGLTPVFGLETIKRKFWLALRKDFQRDGQHHSGPAPLGCI